MVPDDKDIIFKEYYGILKMMIKDGTLAPVYINGLEISFKKGLDRMNRHRNIPRVIKVDIGQMDSKMELTGGKVRTSIRLYLCTTERYLRLLYLRN